MRYERSVESYEVVVVGAGAAGLATAAQLQDRGLRPLVLEAGPEPGAAWRQRYDRLHLHTPRLLSGLPGLRMPRRFGRWVARDDLIEYLRDYAAVHDLDIRMNCRVSKIEPGWTLETSAGPTRARHVVVATGYNGAPVVPDWPGRRSFAGQLLHSSEYRNRAPFRGKDVLVV